jgi:hypothetical protein
MPENNSQAQDLDKKPLGIVLQQAALVSPAQIQLVLQDQKIYTDLKFGEILALRGWVKQETSDFFACEWSKILSDTKKRPLGYYLQQAGLLDEIQIDSILAEQKRLWLRFGALAVLQGCVKQDTIDFFLKNLSVNNEVNHPWITRRYDEDFINRPSLVVEQKKTKEDEEIKDLIKSIEEYFPDESTVQKRKKERDRSFFSTLTESFGKITKPTLNQ